MTGMDDKKRSYRGRVCSPVGSAAVVRLSGRVARPSCFYNQSKDASGRRPIQNDASNKFSWSPLCAERFIIVLTFVWICRTDLPRRALARPPFLFVSFKKVSENSHLPLDLHSKCCSILRSFVLPLHVWTAAGSTGRRSLPGIKGTGFTARTHYILW